MKTNHKVAVGTVAGFGLGVLVVQVLHAQARPPAYTVAEVEVTDPETYKQYIAVGVPPTDGHFIARGGSIYVVNGAPPKRTAIVQWQSLEKAKAFYESEAYKHVIPIRDKSSIFRAYVIEGVAK
jgi:uncharacterized protein (DUF1330 family)